MSVSEWGELVRFLSTAGRSELVHFFTARQNVPIVEASGSSGLHLDHITRCDLPLKCDWAVYRCKVRSLSGLKKALSAIVEGDGRSRLYIADDKGTVLRQHPRVLLDHLIEAKDSARILDAPLPQSRRGLISDTRIGENSGTIISKGCYLARLHIEELSMCSIATLQAPLSEAIVCKVWFFLPYRLYRSTTWVPATDFEYVATLLQIPELRCTVQHQGETVVAPPNVPHAVWTLTQNDDAIVLLCGSICAVPHMKDSMIKSANREPAGFRKGLTLERREFIAEVAGISPDEVRSAPPRKSWKLRRTEALLAAAEAARKRRRAELSTTPYPVKRAKSSENPM
jgi:hypothetical protein